MKAVLILLWATIGKCDPSRFKVCTNSPFCLRFRAWSTLTSRPDRALELASVNTERVSESGTVDFVFAVRSSAESEPNYGLTISVSTITGLFRIRMDDTRPTNPRTRYRIPDGDVIVDSKAGTGVRHTYTTNKNMTSIEVPGMYRIEVDHASFKIRVYNRYGHLIQIVNSNNSLAFEKYRRNENEQCLEPGSDPACHPQINSNGAWKNTFGRFVDNIKYGPSLVGIDIEHVQTVSLHGLAEHTTGFNLPTSTDFRFFNADVFQYPLDSGSALYGSIPLLTSIHSQPSPSVSAVLWLNPSDTFVSLAKSSTSMSSSWVSETGILDMVILVGPTPADVLKQYHYITGLPTLPPIFTLGYQQSKWGYKSQDEVAEISHRFASEKISIDVFWLDIQYTDGKKYFTWEPNTYGDPERLVSTLVSDERRLVTIIDPHIKASDPSYSVYTNLLEKDYFVKSSNSEVFVGDCWPGKSSYPDFTRSDVREYWGSLYSYNHFHGTSPDVMIWNDMNEPSVFDGPEMSFPRDLVHHGGIEHREVHNLYGMYYHRATYEGLLKRDEGVSPIPRRPFVLSRSFFAGSHRYGPIWTGDNNSEWSHLKASIPMLLSLSISGMSFSGADVGGFFGDPTKELYIRWQQAAAAFYPFYRCHAHHDSKYREPWTFDSETTNLVRDAITFRYMMLPHWYTLFGIYATEGIPIIRPLWFDYMSEDSATFDGSYLSLIENQVMVGDSILVRPVIEPGVSEVSIYLPDARSWWYTFDGTKIFQGGRRISFPVTISTIPVFVKAGTILPLKKRVRMSTKRMKNDPTTFRVYEHPDKSASTASSGLYYVDDEETMDYKLSGNFALYEVKYDYSEILMWKKSGNSNSPQPAIAGVELVTRDGKIRNVEQNEFKESGKIRQVEKEESVKVYDRDDSGAVYMWVFVVALFIAAIVGIHMLRRRQRGLTLPRSVHELVNLTSYDRND